MQTMHPVVLRGLTGGSVNALPPEEFRGRVDALQALIREAGFVEVAVFGDARDYGPLCYVTGYMPMLRWAICLVPVVGKPSIFIAAPARDTVFTRTLTWIDDVHLASELPEALEEVSRRGTVALIGGETMRGSIRRLIDPFQRLVDVSEELVSAWMSTPRPLEVDLLRAAQAFTLRTADRAEQELAEGLSITGALAVAERFAREEGAHDVRALYSPDGGKSLRPFETVVDGCPVPQVFYLAVEINGYWGETFRSAQADADLLDRCNVLLDTAAAELRPGVLIKETVERLAALPGGVDRHPVLNERRSVARLGLMIRNISRPGIGGKFVPGIYSLRVGGVKGANGILVSKVVEVGLEGVGA
jgi:hypothetical protein